MNLKVANFTSIVLVHCTTSIEHVNTRKTHFDRNEIDYTVRNSLLQLQKIKI